MALTDNLISYWSLEETSGTRVDDHGTNDLTDNNTVTSATGKVGTGADFELSNSENLSIASNSTLQMGDIDFTIAAWVKHETTTGNQSYVAKADTSSSLTWEYNFRAVSGVLQLVVSDGSTAVTATGATLSTGIWYFVVGINDSVNNEIRLYVDAGTPTTTAQTLVPQTTAYIFRLGARAATASNFLDGVLDEVGIWKRVLTADEITELYNSGSGRDYAYISAAASGVPKHFMHYQKLRQVT